jgi:hypothetical protein
METSVCTLGLKEDMISCLLIGVLVLAACALLGCVLVNYLRAWQDGDARDSHRRRDIAGDSLFTSNWFFVLNVVLCFGSLLGLIVCL